MAKREQEETNREPKEDKRDPKESKREPKVYKRDPKESKREPKGNQRATKMDPKIALGDRVDFGVSPDNLWSHFWLIFRSKSQSKIDAKNDVKKT